MDIAVLNGSPKGELSVTLRYAQFLQRKMPDHSFSVFPVAQDIKRFEEDPGRWGVLMEGISQADGIIWCFPLYYLSVPAQYQRFIELVSERAPELFKGKYAVALTTSIRFFDYLAHDYIQAVSEDFGMHFCGAHSAEMYDLMKSAERERLLKFAGLYVDRMQKRVPVPLRYAPIRASAFEYAPNEGVGTLDMRGKRAVIITEGQEGNLGGMVRRLAARLGATVIDLRSQNIKKGCGGCLQCAWDNVCVTRDLDDVDGIYRSMMESDIIIIAGGMVGRFFSSRWKLFCDRGFFNNHIPKFGGKQMGFLVSGPLAQVQPFRQFLEVFPELQQANNVGIVTDEYGDSSILDQQIDDLSDRLVACAVMDFKSTPTFFSKAGHKIFRDEIWRSLRFVFRKDHQYYRAHGLYDFPRRSVLDRLKQGVNGVLRYVPAYRKEFNRRLREEMVRPFTRIQGK